MNRSPWELRQLAELLFVLALVGAAAMLGGALMKRVVGDHPLG